MTTIHVKIKSHWPTAKSEWEGDVELPPADECGTRDAVNQFIFRHFNRVDFEDTQRLEQMDYELSSISVGDEFSWYLTDLPDLIHNYRVGLSDFDPLPNC